MARMLIAAMALCLAACEVQVEIKVAPAAKPATQSPKDGAHLESAKP